MPEWKQEIRWRLAPLKLAPTREAEIVEELAQHLEDRYAELLSGGATPEEACREALTELSESEALERELRRVERPVKQEPVVLGARRTNMLKDGLQDLRYGLRLLRRNPGFAAVAVLSLAIGIGANSVIFTAMDAALWKPLPVADPDSLVSFEITRSNRDDMDWIPTAFADGLAKSGVFTDIITQTSDGLSFSYGDRAERIVGEVVSPNFFPALGVAPILGQGFTPEVRAGRRRSCFLTASGSGASRETPASLAGPFILIPIPSPLSASHRQRFSISRAASSLNSVCPDCQQGNAWARLRCWIVRRQ